MLLRLHTYTLCSAYNFIHEHIVTWWLMNTISCDLPVVNTEDTVIIDSLEVATVVDLDPTADSGWRTLILYLKLRVRLVLAVLF